MAWEERNGKRYYYRKVWAAGRVISEYVGHGPIVELVAEYEALETQQRQAQAALRRDKRTALFDEAQEPEALRAYACHVAEAVKAVLTGLGFHQPKRTWRLKRMTDLANTNDAQQIVRALDLYRKKSLTSLELVEYKQLLKTHASLPKVLGDPPATVRLYLMNLYDGKPAIQAAVDARFEQVRRELGYKESTALEQLLIDEVALRWLDLYRTEILYGQQIENQFDMRQVQRLEDILKGKQGRYLRAIESLARVRRLLKLTIQINVATPGSQQLNIAGDVTT